MLIQIAIVGGGTGGLTIGAQLLKTGRFSAKDITIFDPSEIHHYQPSYTMIGGGIFGNPGKDNSKMEFDIVMRPEQTLLDIAGLGESWNKNGINQIEPDSNSLILQN